MLTYLAFPHLLHVMGTLLNPKSIPWQWAYTSIRRKGHNDLSKGQAVKANCKLN